MYLNPTIFCLMLKGSHYIKCGLYKNVLPAIVFVIVPCWNDLITYILIWNKITTKWIRMCVLGQSELCMVNINRNINPLCTWVKIRL